MKSAIVLLALAAVVCAERYSQEKYINIDVEEIIKNRDQLKSFVSCFTDNTTCDSFTGLYKEDFPDVVKTACKECTPLHKHILRRFLEGAAQTFPAETKVLAGKIDPKNELFPALKAALANA